MKRTILYITKKILKNKWIIRNLPISILFNFHYLPFNQAIKLPIILYKPNIQAFKGKIILDLPKSCKIKTGMIKLGVNTVNLYENNGIKYENRGGKIIFKGKCHIGNNSSISIGPNGIIEFGNNFCATASLKLVCYKKIKLGNNCLFGWECIILDTDFHQLSNHTQDNKNDKSGNIIIGNGCWFALRNTILKNTEIPDFCVIASNSMTNKRYDIPKYSLIAGNPAVIKKNGVYLKDHKVSID